MYLDILIDIKDDIPEITSKNISHIDNYLGSVGTNNIFTKKDFLSVVTQKSLSEKILNWLTEHQIIIPKYAKCPNCGENITFDSIECNVCSFKILNSLEIVEYEIISNLNYSDLEKKALNEKNQQLANISYKLLCSRLQQKKRKQENGYIIFIDLADSTELGKRNQYEKETLIKQIRLFYQDILKSFFYRYSGIYIKADGDSSWIYLDNKETVSEFFRIVEKQIYKQNFFSLIKELNSQYNLNIFLKIYVSNSPVTEFTKTDNHSIDFDAMDAFTYISRIEKESKKKILSDYPTKNNFPYFIVSTSNDFGITKIHLENITNFPEGFDVWYSDADEIQKIINN